MESFPQFNVILATDSNGGFSYKNQLPWRFIKDMRYYHTTTSFNVNNAPNILIMGRKTWDSMKCVVPKNRIAFVITRQCDKYNWDKEFVDSKLSFFRSFSEALSNASLFPSSNIWVIGGYQIYDEALKHESCNTLYLTTISGVFETDKQIDLSLYNIEWNTENIIEETDVNKLDDITYTLEFKQGTIII